MINIRRMINNCCVSFVQIDLIFSARIPRQTEEKAIIEPVADPAMTQEYLKLADKFLKELQSAVSKTDMKVRTNCFKF